MKKKKKTKRTEPRTVYYDLVVRYFSLVEHLERQLEWSRSTFGPGSAKQRWRGIVDHIAKELEEIARKPMDVEEWIDVAILAFDGALRAAGSADAVVAALSAKQRKNMQRAWPDWRTVPAGKAIEHIKRKKGPLP